MRVRYRRGALSFAGGGGVAVAALDERSRWWLIGGRGLEWPPLVRSTAWCVAGHDVLAVATIIRACLGNRRAAGADADDVGVHIAAAAAADAGGISTDAGNAIVDAAVRGNSTGILRFGFL